MENEGSEQKPSWHNAGFEELNEQLKKENASETFDMADRCGATKKKLDDYNKQKECEVMYNEGHKYSKVATACKIGKSRARRFFKLFLSDKKKLRKENGLKT